MSPKEEVPKKTHAKEGAVKTEEKKKPAGGVVAYFKRECWAIRTSLTEYCFSNGFDTWTKFLLFFAIPLALSVIATFWAWDQVYKIGEWESNPEFGLGPHYKPESEYEEGFAWGQPEEL